MVVPFSPLFCIWNSVLLLIFVYDVWMVLFSISLAYNFTGVFYIINGVTALFYFADIFMRACTAITKPETVCLDRAKVLEYYVENWLLLDVLAFLPLDLLTLPYVPEPLIKYVLVLRLLRLCKTGRVFELMRIGQSASDQSSWVFVFVKLAIAFVFSSHLMACVFVYIGRHSTTTDRYDG